MNRHTFLQLLGAALATGLTQSIFGKPLEQDKVKPVTNPLADKLRPSVTIGLVGDPGVGKTSMIRTLSTGGFPDSGLQVPVAGILKQSYKTGSGQTVHLRMKEAGANEPASFYNGMKAILVVFSITSNSSLDATQARWSGVLKRLAPGIPIILVGNKLDLRNDESTISALAAKGLRVISNETGQQVARTLGAIQYLECSALTQVGLKNAFDAGIAAVKL